MVKNVRVPSSFCSSANDVKDTLNLQLDRLLLETVFFPYDSLPTVRVVRVF